MLDLVSIIYGGTNMEVYSWKTLIVTILIGGWAFINQFNKLMSGELFAFFEMIFWGVLIFKGLYISFTKEGFEVDMRRGALRKKAIKELFGSWAFIAPYGGLVLIVLAGVSYKLIPSHIWIAILFFIIGLVYHIIVGILVGKYVKMEEKKYL